MPTTTSTRETRRVPFDPAAVPVLDRSDEALSDAACPETAMLEHEAKACLRSALDSLRERERRVIALRYGLDGEASHSLQDMAATVGVSGERVRQIEMEARGRLRRRLSRTPIRVP